MKNFIFEGDYKGGLFKYFRDTYQYYHKLVQVTSEDYFTGGFCDLPSLQAECIIDGRDDTAWSNGEQSESKQYVDIDLGNETFALTEFVFESACVPPSTLQILGSNDYSNFIEICELTNFQADETQKFACDSHNEYYRFYRLKQIGPDIINLYYLRIIGIEFYGRLGKKMKTIKCENKYYRILFTGILCALK